MLAAAGVLGVILSLLHGAPQPELPKLTDSLSRAITASRNRIEDHIAYRHLLSPDSDLVVGRACGIVGTPPPGQRDLATLVDHERTDLLSRALGAPTPEARVYAALGLWSLRTIGDDERRRFVGRITGPVRMCSGCLFWSASATEAVAGYDEHVGVRSLDS